MRAGKISTPRGPAHFLKIGHAACGDGSPTWKVEADTSAPSKPNVLKQLGSGTFPWCVKQSVRIADGFVEVKFKPLAGREDQAGGVLWRFKDANNYYIARANGLENNISLYYVEKGRRITIKYVVGVWTKADSVTAFDDFSYGGTMRDPG